MSLPTPEKTWTWTHVVPTPTGARADDCKALIYGVKEALKALPNPWTVAGSNNGTTAAMDGVDRWTSASVITNDGTSGHTWIVLEAPSGWNNGQLLLYCDNGGSFSFVTRTKVSPGGLFTGGTTTTVPTATDEDTVFADEFVDLNTGGSGSQMTSHIAQSSDGQHTRWFNCDLGRPNAFMCFETLGSAGSADARAWGRGPAFMRESPPLGPNALAGNARRFMRIVNPDTGAFAAMYVMFPMIAATRIWDYITIPNEISGEFPLWNYSLYDYITAGVKGRAGYLKDWWFTVNAANPGDAFPGDGSKQFMVLGSGIIVPWDGSTPDFG